MSQYSGPYSPREGGPDQSSTTDVAKGEAAEVGRSARDAGGHVAQTASDQARQVAAETGRQARDLLGEASGQAQQQAAVQQQKAAQQLHSLAGELHDMAEQGGQSGTATEIARQAADRMHGAASWLEQREPRDLLEEVRSFARRRPGAFLIGAAVAGLAAGRLTRGLKDQHGSDSGSSQVTSGSAPTVPDVTAAGPAGYGSPVETTGYPAEPAGYPPEPVYPSETIGGTGDVYPPVTETQPGEPYPTGAETYRPGQP